MESSSQIITQLKRHLVKNYSSKIKDVILFGSRVKGNYKEFSDYDVLIILDDDYSGKDENTILDLCYDIDLKYNILLDVHILSNSELSSARGRQPVFVNAIKSGIYA
jgi:predicted nucleotidyltransferase